MMFLNLEWPAIGPLVCLPASRGGFDELESGAPLTTPAWPWATFAGYASFAPASAPARLDPPARLRQRITVALAMAG
ncbi:hypothetical protein [Novosphingobium sp. Rr 2-17]|uniref:hypothetical protein n=1 Tax=Novosphingobium sp. Rr 2-17 TaxID=555793 RepID=UPI001ED901EF|nr:hypothetical protein [Novosphingobium sp. Rr 2-17]